MGDSARPDEETEMSPAQWLADSEVALIEPAPWRGYLLPVSPIGKFGEYLADGGGRGLERAFELGQIGTIDEITRAGLRGRGGAGFPTGRKWASVRNNGSGTRFVVANAAEGEPATFKDRLLIRRDPFRLIELQSLDRIHRLGLPPGTETRMTFLVSVGTIDEIVDSRVRVKAERLSMMLADPNLAMMALPDEEDYGTWIDDEDFHDLFAHLTND